MDAADVYKMRPEYKKFPFEWFKPNLKNLRKKIESERTRAETDAAAYRHDRQLLLTLRANCPPVIEWHKSQAKYLLRQDIEDGKNKVMAPSELYSTRAEYQEFTLKVFRNHIYQEIKRIEKRKDGSRFTKRKYRASAPTADSL